MGNLNFVIQPPTEEQMERTYDDTPIPAGEYQVVIYDYAEDENKKKTGRWLRLAFEVKGGPQDGKDFSIFYNYQFYAAGQVDERGNLTDEGRKAQMAQDITAEKLSRLCRAIGLSGTLKNAEEILHHELIVETEIEIDKRDGTQRVAVKKYKPLPQAAPAPQAPTKAANQSNFDDPVPNLGGEEKAPWQS